MSTPIVNDASWDPRAKDCPSRSLFVALGDRWNMLIMLALKDGPLRNKDVRKKVEGISEKVLAGRLEHLVEDGLLSRVAYPETPPRVVYELTELGTSALTPIQALYDWTVDNMDEVAKLRAEHEK